MKWIRIWIEALDSLIRPMFGFKKVYNYPMSKNIKDLWRNSLRSSIDGVDLFRETLTRYDGEKVYIERLIPQDSLVCRDPNHEHPKLDPSPILKTGVTYFWQLKNVDSMEELHRAPVVLDAIAMQSKDRGLAIQRLFFKVIKRN